MSPSNYKVIESLLGSYWVDNEGILCVISKNAPDPGVEERTKQFEEIRNLLGDKRTCLLIDITNASPTSKESRTYNAHELPKLFNAVAFITSSPLGKMLAHLYLGISIPSIPAKIFLNEKDAREWLRQYM